MVFSLFKKQQASSQTTSSTAGAAAAVIASAASTVVAPSMTTPQRNIQLSGANPPPAASPILQADELCLNPRWSPHLKSPPPNTTIASRLRLQDSPLANGGRSFAPTTIITSDGDDDDAPDDDSFSSTLFSESEADPSGRPDVLRGVGAMSSPLSKRARILQNNSPESLPPLSPILSSRKRSLRADLAQDTPSLFSPNSSGLRIRYSPKSPMSPTPRARAVAGNGDPESPTMLGRLAMAPPKLVLCDNMGDSSSIGDDDGESPTVSQMSRSLLFRLDLLSPTARRNSCSSSEEDMTDDEIPPSLAADKIASSSPPPLSSLLDPNALDMHVGEDIGQDIGQVGDEIAETEKRVQPFQLRRPNNLGKGILIDAKSGQKQHERVAKAVVVPQIFVSPLLPRSDRGTEKAISKELKLVRHHFDRNFGGFETDFSAVTVDCGMPRFVNRALFRYATRSSNDSAVSPLSGSEVIGKRVHRSDSGSWPSYEHFCDVWTRLRRSSADDSALLFNILTDDATKPRAYVTRDEIKLLVTDVVDNHFELEFLEGQDMFAQSYAETVTERIFYEGNRTWDGKMTLAQFRRADIVGLMRTIEEGIDIDNRDPGVFSYKHFYVLFCSFFELDADRDRLLDARDLLRYFTNTLSRRIISRIMMGKGKKSEHPAKNGSEVAAARAKAKAHKRKDGKIMYSRYDLNVRLSACRMTYRDFIWFLLSEIDKSTPPAIEYWFRCLDLDGDGVLSVYELEYFYDEQVSRMEEEMSGDMIMLDDLMCQLSDMVRPEKEGMFTLKDLRRAPSKLMPIFFDAFMNLQRFLEHEARTSFLQRQLAQLSQRALPTVPFKEVIQARMEFLACLPSPWVEFADQEYAALMNDQGEQSGENIDDFSSDSTGVGVNVSDSGN